MGQKKLKLTYVRNTTEMEEYVKCSRSPMYFINTYVRIPHPMRGEIPFKLYPFQIGLLLAYLKYRYTVCLKPRQMGVSMLIAAFALWMALFHTHKNITIVSIKQSVARALLRRIKYMYERLPTFLRVEVVNGGAGQYGTADEMMFANRSEIKVTSSSEDAARSDSLSLLIMDEVAFQRYATQIWGAAQPTLSTGGQAILLSTAFGMGNFFHQTWTGAVQNMSNGFFPVKLDWRMHPERDQLWYDEQLRVLGEKRTAQEIDCNFLKSGYNVFNLEKIRAIEDRLLTLRKQVFENGNLYVYFPYDPKRTYTIGADVSTGHSRDFSAFSIMDDLGREAACYKGKIGIRQFGHLLMKWGQKYGTALLAPEANAIGEGIISVLQEAYYPNIYNRVHSTLKIGDIYREESLIQGWYTTGRTRHEIITRMDDDLNDDLVEVNNPFFVQESYTFIYNEQNKPIALGKELGRGSVHEDMYEDQSTAIYTDDSILAECITNFVRQNPARFRGNLPFGSGN